MEIQSSSQNEHIGPILLNSGSFSQPLSEEEEIKQLLKFYLRSQNKCVRISLLKAIENLSEEKRNLWDRLWMMSDRRSGPVHPLIYSHPDTGKPVLCFHLGMTDGFIIDYKKSTEKKLSNDETAKILSDIHHEIVKNDGAILYQHKYEAGDFIISDNLAVGHEASPDTQHSREVIGLRVMHRVTIAGKHKPSKQRSW